MLRSGEPSRAGGTGKPRWITAEARGRTATLSETDGGIPPPAAAVILSSHNDVRCSLLTLMR